MKRAYKNPTAVDAYYEAIPEPFRRIAGALRGLIREALPDAEERLWHGMPYYDVCYVAAYEKHLNLGFTLGAHIDDPKGLLEGTGKSLRHVKIRAIGDVKARDLGPLLRASWKLHAEGGES